MTLKVRQLTRSSERLTGHLMEACTMLRKIMIVLVAGAALSGATTAEAFHSGGGHMGGGFGGGCPYRKPKSS